MEEITSAQPLGALLNLRAHKKRRACARAVVRAVVRGRAVVRASAVVRAGSVVRARARAHARAPYPKICASGG